MVQTAAVGRATPEAESVAKEGQVWQVCFKASTFTWHYGRRSRKPFSTVYSFRHLTTSLNSLPVNAFYFCASAKHDMMFNKMGDGFAPHQIDVGLSLASTCHPPIKPGITIF